MTTGRQSKFVVVEGLDGTGTTTLAGILADGLQARDLQVRVTSEPTTRGAFGRLLWRHIHKEIHLDPHTAALAFTADRREHLDQLIRPQLGRGRWVISDRYILSTLAYQGAEGVSREAILEASSGFETPDVTFLLDAPDDVRHGRMASREREDRYEERGFADRLRESYMTSADLLRSRGHRIDVIDADRPLDEVLADVMSRVDAAS